MSEPESESESEADDEEILFRLAALAKVKEQLKGGKVKKPPPKPPSIKLVDGFLQIEGRLVLVNGCKLSKARSGSLLGTNDEGRTFRVTRDAATVPFADWTKITLSGGHASIGGTALSLEGWKFCWDVAIGDADKYIDAAWKAYRDITDLTLGSSQCYGALGMVGGYNAHVSIVTADVRQELKKKIAAGKEPKAGWLCNLNFHVTLEVYAKDHPDNPRTFQSVSWKGNTGKLPPDLKPATVHQQGSNWLSTHI